MCVAAPFELIGSQSIKETCKQSLQAVRLAERLAIKFSC